MNETIERELQDDGSSISYGPWDDERWSLSATTSGGDRVRLLLGENAMYELWVETQSVPWSREPRPEGTLRREIVELIVDQDEQALREILELVESEVRPEP